MAVETDIAAGEVFLASAKTFSMLCKMADGTTPQTMTGWLLALVIRDEAGAAVLSKASPAIVISNGLATDDKAAVTAAAADWASTAVKGWHDWAWWRTDTTNDVLLAYGRIYLGKAAAQP